MSVSFCDRTDCLGNKALVLSQTVRMEAIFLIEESVVHMGGMSINGQGVHDGEESLDDAGWSTVGPDALTLEVCGVVNIWMTYAPQHSPGAHVLWRSC